MTADREKDVERCEEDRPHPEIVARILEKMPKEEQLSHLADLFKVFGDPTRMRILFLLFESEVCVCDIAALLGMTQSAISHQLRVLKQNRLVRSRRQGKEVYYALSDDHVSAIVKMGFEHICEGWENGSDTRV